MVHWYSIGFLFQMSRVQLPSRCSCGKENPTHIPGAERRKTLKNLVLLWNSLWRVMWHHLTYRVASGSVSPWKTGGKENPLMKPCPTIGRRVTSSDVQQHKIVIRGGCLQE